MKKLQDLAIAINAASDAGDEEALRQLGKECEESLDGATGEDRVFLFYCQANTYSATDAVDLAALRHQAEHRFLSFQESEYGPSSDTHRMISITGFEGRTLRLLRWPARL